MPSLHESRIAARGALEAAGIEAPGRTAEALLAHVLGRDRAYLYAHPEEELTPEQAARLAAAVGRRAGGEPLQYITGEEEFRGRRFEVSPAVLIPRPETELLVEAALERMAPEAAVRAADVGTGSGCIAVTLALERPWARVLATDTSAAALGVARANAARLGAAVEFLECDLLAGIEGGLDLVVSNPPYIAEAEYATLAREVREHEPRAALAAGPEGSEAYARLIPQARERLRPGGWLLLELGYSSEAAVRALLGEGWGSVTVRRDAQGWPRVLSAQRLP